MKPENKWNRKVFEGLCLLFLPCPIEAFDNILIKKKNRKLLKAHREKEKIFNFKGATT